MLPHDFLKGKNIIITGGSSGIGKCLAIAFAELGASVGLISRSEDKLEKIINTITDKGQRAIYEVGDVSNYDDLKKGVEKIIADFGTVHAIYCNAGILRKKHFTRFRADQIEKIIDINLKGAMYSAHAILPHFLENKSGSIVFTSSISSLIPSPGMSIYAASKSGMNAFSLCLAEEVRPKKIRVNLVLPGFIDTPMMHFGLTDENVQSLNPLDVEEVVPYFAFFASDKSKKVTGRMLNLDSFKNFISLINNLPEDIPRDWNGIKEKMKDITDDSDYKSLRIFRKLIPLVL